MTDASLIVPLMLLGALVGAGLALVWRAKAAPAASEPAPSIGSGPPAAGEPDLWRRMLDGIPEPALVLDRDGLVLGANAEAHNLFPIGVARHITSVTRSPELMEAVNAARLAHETQICRLRLVAPVERHIDGAVTPLGTTESAGEPSLLIVLSDATDQHQLARLRADFVANASHELRTPLASLKGFIETLQGAAKDDAAAREKFLAIMQAQAARMSRLIDDLLSLSLIEMREHVAPQGHVDLVAVAQSTVHSLAPLAAEANITLTLRPDEGAASGATTVVGERDELAQVVQNLAQNAIKYGRPGGKVEIALERRGRHVVLSVVDDGIGIAPQHLPRLTERFYRVSAKDSRERGGTGLGLAIVKHIVNRHGGELKVASTLGAGSTFSVWLPAAK